MIVDHAPIGRLEVHAKSRLLLVHSRPRDETLLFFALDVVGRGAVVEFVHTQFMNMSLKYHGIYRTFR